MRKALITSLIVVSLVLISLPVIATQDHEKGFIGDIKVFEKDKPSGTPTKPGKPGGDDEGSSDPDPNVNKWAVVIGIADYAGIGNDLKYPDDDAKDIYSYLRSKGYPAGNIKLLLDGQATAQNIIAVLDWMETYVNADSEFVFYYSGHGTTVDGYADGDGEYTDEAIVSVDLYAILDTDLADELNDLVSQKMGIMFDSCFSGGMVNDMDGQGWVISTACGETELSYDGSAKMKNGIWTYYFLIGLDTYDTIEQAHAYAANIIAKYYNNLMTPVLSDGYSPYWSF